MRLTQQFGMKKSLDHLFQLLYMSTILFSNFESQEGLHVLHLKYNCSQNYTEAEVRQLLSYFLDLVEYFTHERIHLIQDPLDETQYALSGGF